MGVSALYGRNITDSGGMYDTEGASLVPERYSKTCCFVFPYDSHNMDGQNSLRFSYKFC